MKVEQPRHHSNNYPSHIDSVWLRCENALADIFSLADGGQIGANRIKFWLVSYHDLFQKAKGLRLKHSCFGTLPCECSNASSQYRFYQLYNTLLEVVELHEKEEHFKEQLEMLEKSNEHLKDWIKQSEDSMIHGFSCIGLDFWSEQDFSEHTSLRVVALEKTDGFFCLRSEDFQFGLQLLNAYREAYLSCLRTE